VLVVQFSNNRGPWSELDCGVVDVGSGLANYLKEFGDETEIIGGGVEKRTDVSGYLNRTELASRGREKFTNPNTPRSAIP
jgi:hypothetical protein